MEDADIILLAGQVVYYLVVTVFLGGTVMMCAAAAYRSYLISQEDDLNIVGVIFATIWLVASAILALFSGLAVLLLGEYG